MTEAPSIRPTPGILRRILTSPPAATSLGVFLLITALCWLAPALWIKEPNTTRLSLGATAPLATIYDLTPAGSDTPDRLIDETRAQQLIRNGLSHELPGSGIDIANEPSIVWIEIPPIIRSTSGGPIRPVWILPESVEAFFQQAAEQLPEGLSSLPGPPEQFATYYQVHTSPVRFLAGTDELGRDLLARTLVGGRLSIAVGLAATLVSVTIGIVYGGVAGYIGGKLDSLMMRFVDILYALPFLIFVILLMVVFPRSLLLLFLAIGAVEWLTTARIVRGEGLSIKKLPFVDAARTLGLSHGTILFRHILPNTLPPVIVYATLTIPTVILLESVLSFLGLGVHTAPGASSSTKALSGCKLTRGC